MSRTFKVTTERGRGHCWVAECAEVGAISQVRRLDQAADDIREAIAYLADHHESGVDIPIEPGLPPDYQQHWDAAECSTAEAAAAGRGGSAEEFRKAMSALRAAQLAYS